MSLEITDLSVKSDGKEVVSNITFTVNPGQIIAILGSNGAGKSELVLGIAGMLSASGGRVTVDGTDITGKSPDIVRVAGVAAVPEGHKVLTQLTVDENLRAAGSLRWSDLEANLLKTYKRFPELAARKSQLAGTLSGGQQQMVALAHALMSAPEYLIIDEMSLGLPTDRQTLVWRRSRIAKSRSWHRFNRAIHRLSVECRRPSNRASRRPKPVHRISKRTAVGPQSSG